LEQVSKNKTRVLIIISSPGMGGIEKQVLAFLRRYDRTRFIVDVACGGSIEGALRDKYLETGTKLILCRWSRYIIPYVWCLFRLLKRERYDVIHTHAAETCGAAILAARLAGVPVRIASYDHTKTHWRKPGLLTTSGVKILQWINRRFATKIYGDAEVCLDVYYPDWRNKPDLFEICYDGVDIEKFSTSGSRQSIRKELSLSTDCLVVGHVGSFKKVKNHKTIVDMASIVAKKVEDVYFLLVGDGDLRQQTERQASAVGLRQRFIFTGNRNDVPQLLSAMDVFVMPSLDEGFGLAVAEAQLGGLPVVASDILGIREALCPSMHKFCRQPLDSKGMAEQVILLLENHQLRSRLGHEGKEYVTKRFSIDMTVKQLESAYDSLTPTTC
jgi:glycosyltransferase EpsF